MKTVAVTGFSGFIGSNLIAFLKNEDINVVCIDLRTTNDFFIDNNVDVVIHLAGKAHDLKNVANAEEYNYVNFELTKNIYDAFCKSNASKFLFLSSIKAVADCSLDYAITEKDVPAPLSIYGKSKLLAENYILENNFDKNKKVFVLRPTLIHGKGHKGNFKLLEIFVSLRIPWFFKAFKNRRSFCTLDNLLFVIKELIYREDINSGIYNICDDEYVSTNELIKIIAKTKGSNLFFVAIPTRVINIVFFIFDFLRLPLNRKMLLKITGSFEVSNTKIIDALKKDLPYSSKAGLIKTFSNISNKKQFT